MGWKGKIGGREEEREGEKSIGWIGPDWAGLGVLCDGSMMACGDPGMEESSDTDRKCMYG